jgi:hypothetical protein
MARIEMGIARLVSGMGRLVYDRLLNEDLSLITIHHGSSFRGEESTNKYSRRCQSVMSVKSSNGPSCADMNTSI